MTLHEIFVTALAIMDEKGGSQAQGGYEMLWTRDWEWLRGLLLDGLSRVKAIEEIMDIGMSIEDETIPALVN